MKLTQSAKYKLGFLISLYIIIYKNYHKSILNSKKVYNIALI